MNETTPVERVARILELSRFRRMANPLQIASLHFDIPAAFIGEPPSPDLVIVGDTVTQKSSELQRLIEGIGRALDVVQSRRPLTLVLVGPRLDSSALTVLTRYARVLPIGDHSDEASIRNWLAVLLPLTLPKPADARGLDCLNELRPSTPAEVQVLLDLASLGSNAVAERFAAMVEEPFVEHQEPEGRVG